MVQNPYHDKLERSTAAYRTVDRRFELDHRTVEGHGVRHALFTQKYRSLISLHFHCIRRCGKKVPFGALSLDHFLNASRVLLPENRNVFMMTDDPKWLSREMQKYYASRKQHADDTMHIFMPSIRPNHRGGTFNSSVDFWASITMARQCQAVVGHMGSAAFVVIYNNLCYYHDNQFFKCPPVYDTAGTEQ